MSAWRRWASAACLAVASLMLLAWGAAPASADHCADPMETHDGLGNCAVSGVSTTTTSTTEPPPTTTTTEAPTTTTTAAPTTTTTTEPPSSSAVSLCASRGESEPCEPLDLTLVGSIVMVVGAVLGLSLARAVIPPEKWLT